MFLMVVLENSLYLCIVGNSAIAQSPRNNCCRCFPFLHLCMKVNFCLVEGPAKRGRFYTTPFKALVTYFQDKYFYGALWSNLKGQISFTMSLMIFPYVHETIGKSLILCYHWCLFSSFNIDVVEFSWSCVCFLPFNQDGNYRSSKKH